MSKPLEIDVITIFPGMLKGFLEESMLGRAAAKGARKAKKQRQQVKVDPNSPFAKLKDLAAG